MSLEEYRRRAEQAEARLAKLEQRVESLGGQGLTGRVMGLPSSMGDDSQLTLRKMFERGVNRQPDNTVVTKIIGGYHSMTYRDVQANATRLASAMSKLGVGPGDRVATFMWNNCRHLQLYYALPCMGAVVHTLNIRLHPKELAYIIEHAEDKLLFVDQTLVPLLLKVDAGVLSKIQNIVICGINEAPGDPEKAKGIVSNGLDYDALLATGDPTFDWPDLDERSACGLCYTSGTTGHPKGVLYSHRSTVIHTLVGLGTDVMQLTGTDVVLPFVPMFHALAWGIPFNALTVGFKLLMWNHFRTGEDIMQIMLDQKGQILAGVPTVLTGCMQEIQKNPDKYAPLKGVWNRATCGGTAPPPSMIRWYWEAMGVELIHGWGMTETNPIGSISRRAVRMSDLELDDEAKLANSTRQGLPPPLVELKIVKPDSLDEELPWDDKAMGELLIRGPTVCTNYFKIDAADKFHRGWLKTGDIASFTPGGEIVIRDRSKDLIKSGGEWISSAGIENAVVAMPQVAMACCVGMPHPKWDERPVVVVKVVDGKTVTTEEVRKHLSQDFSKFQLPDEVLIWDEIPVSGTGKMEKMKVRARLADESYVLPDQRK